MDALALTLIWIAALLLIGCGVIGTVLPALPGSPLIFLGALLVAWWQDFSVIGWVPLSILGALALFSVAVDYVSSALGAKRAGASAVALAGAFIGSFMGFFIGLPGIVLGPFIGALIGAPLVRDTRIKDEIAAQTIPHRKLGSHEPEATEGDAIKAQVAVV